MFHRVNKYSEVLAKKNGCSGSSRERPERGKMFWFYAEVLVQLRKEERLGHCNLPEKSMDRGTTIECI